MNVTTEYEVAVPTMGTLGGVTVLETFPSAKLYVPEDEFEDYEMFYPGSVISVPQAETWADLANYALAHATKPNVLILGHSVYGAGAWKAGKWRHVRADGLDRLIRNGFLMAREADVPLWGLQASSNKNDYQTFAPFTLLRTVPACWSGHVCGHGLQYDRRMGPWADVDMTLQALRSYRRVLRFQYLHALQAGVGASQGRSIEELEAGERGHRALVVKWGSRIVRYYNSETMELTLSVPIRGC